MSDAPYSNRELDAKFAALHHRVDNDILPKMDETLTQVKLTNGKVKRIILVLVALTFFCIGLGLSQPQIIGLIFAAL